MRRLPAPLSATLPGVGVLLVGLSLPFWFISDQYSLVIAITVVIWSIAAQGWNVIGGYGGLMSFGHSVFFGIGAYTTAILQVSFGVSPWIGMVVGAVLAAVVGAILTYPALRLKGIYFALATFVIALLMTDLDIIAVPITGGDLGITLPFVRNDPGLLQFDSRVTLYFVLVTFLAAVTLVVGWIAKSRLGLRLRATRDDPDAARAAGVDVTRVRLVGLIISAAITSVAGTLMLEFLSAVTPATGFGIQVGITIAMGALVGGRGTILGPIIGVAILIPAQQMVAAAIPQPAGISGIVYAVIIIVVIMLDSRGVLHLLSRLVGWLVLLIRRRPDNTPVETLTETPT
ncbi:branched-chain amino acid ABC transporter permease [Microbacterium sp.]|uniref:branched-chain amino acid ABC transporter permease n=1 Tax=Microbacterium sp. TaxID=51671 RepID=UPI003A8D968F